MLGITRDPTLLVVEDDGTITYEVPERMALKDSGMGTQTIMYVGPDIKRLWAWENETARLVIMLTYQWLRDNGMSRDMRRFFFRAHTKEIVAYAVVSHLHETMRIQFTTLMGADWPSLTTLENGIILLGRRLEATGLNTLSRDVNNFIAEQKPGPDEAIALYQWKSVAAAPPTVNQIGTQTITIPPPTPSQPPPPNVDGCVIPASQDGVTWELVDKTTCKWQAKIASSSGPTTLEDLQKIYTAPTNPFSSGWVDMNAVTQQGILGGL